MSPDFEFHRQSPINTNMLPNDRIFGLDLLRAVAVLMVIFHHCLLFLIAPKWATDLGWLGEIGVCSLLLLSGYLIGQGLIRKSREGRLSKFSHLRTFYLRRWMRTLPPYYVYLLFMAALLGPFSKELYTHKEYFLFLQNFAWNQPFFYSQTWTLAVLEFFYLFFPIILFAASKFVRNHLLCLAIPMAVLFFVPITLKALHTQIATPLEFENTFRKWVVYSLDTPIIGVATALTQSELPSVWTWFLRYSWVGLCTFGGVIVYYLDGRPGLYSSHWLQVIFFPTVALSLAPLLPILCNWKSNRSLPGLALSWVSQVSYSLYVSHIFALSIGVCLLVILGIPQDRLLLVVPLYLMLMALITVPTYFLTEEPFIRLRESNARSLLPGVHGQVLRTVGGFVFGWATAWKRPDRALEEQPPA